MTNNHLILNQVVDVNFSNKENVQELFTEISRLFNSRIIDVTKDVLDKHIHMDEYVRLEKLEVDLGDFSFPISKEEFVTKYQNSLDEALSIQIKLLKSNSQNSTIRKADYYVNNTPQSFLEFYLKFGIIPVWANSLKLSDPQLVLERMLLYDKIELKLMLLKLIHNENVRKRIVYNFSLESIASLVHIIEPVNAEFILDYHKKVSNIQRNEQIVKVEITSFDRAVWAFIFDFIFNNFGSEFNKKMFVKSTLKLIASSFNISLWSILSIFSKAFQSFKNDFKSINILSDIIHELSSEVLDLHMPFKIKKNEPIEIVNSEKDNFQVLSYYLSKGVFPIGKSFVNRDELMKYFSTLIISEPHLIIELIGIIAVEKSVRKRLVYDFGETLIKSLIKLIEPNNYESIINYFIVITEIQNRYKFVKINEVDYRNLLLELIFDAVFLRRNSVFSMKVLVEETIRRQANHYNLDFNKLLSFHIQGIAGQKNSDSNNSNLLFLLFNILKEIENNLTTSVDVHLIDRKIFGRIIDSGSNRMNDLDLELIKNLDISEDIITQKDLIRNILIYWLEHGILPWWAKKIIKNEVLITLNDFIKNHPQDAVLIFVYSASNNLICNNFYTKYYLYFDKILILFENGKEVIEIRDLFFDWCSEFDNFNFKNEIKDQIFILIVHVYKINNFKYFDKSVFIFIVFQKYLEFSKLSQSTFSNFIIRSLENAPNSEFKSLVSEYLKFIFSNNNKSDYQFDILSNFSKLDVDNVIFKAYTEQENHKIVFENEYYNILEYYLKNEKLPSYISFISRYQIDDFIYRIVILLNNLNGNSIRNLFNKNNNSNVALMNIHDIFSRKTLFETTYIKKTLSEFFNRDLINFVSENGMDRINYDSNLSHVLLEIRNNFKNEVILSRFLIFFESPSFRHHASNFYSDDDFFLIIEKIDGIKHIKLLKKFVSLIDLVFLDSLDNSKFRICFKEFCFSLFSKMSNFVFTESFILQEFIKFLSQNKGLNTTFFIDKILDFKKKNIKTNENDFKINLNNVYIESSKITNNYLNILNVDYNNFKEILDKNIDLKSKKSENSVNPFGEIEDYILPERKKSKIDQLMIGEQLFVSNAGLILLHPFLPTLYSRTGLMFDGKFIDEEKRNRAAVILEYLVAGSLEYIEHELLLNKLLCGIDIEEVISNNIQLTEIEIAVADDLLRNVILSWEKLKNTSVEGLRVSFLKRDAYLTLNEESWNLKVDQKGLDILLNTLPWGIGLIKTSWMKKSIDVVWI